MSIHRQEPLDSYLRSFINYERYKYFPKKVDLADYKDFLRKAGDPQGSLSPSVLIAGTNGKGSTAAILSSILRFSGYRVGTFSSPHLFSYRERIQINGRAIPKQEFARCIRELKPVLDEAYQRLRRTFFEVLTTVAFVHFRNHRTDVNMLEVGLGGRKDSTNVVTPLISVITPIVFDHTRPLGSTLSSIAHEKCGIIKEGGTVVSSRQHRHALKVIRDTARRRKAKLFCVDSDSAPVDARFDEKGIRFRYRGEVFQLPLRGHFQWDNLCTALLAIEILQKKGFSISKDALRRGLQRCELKGRFDIVERNPLLVLDGAHNPSAIRALHHSIQKLFPERKLVVVFSCLTSKDKRSMARTIERYAETVILTRIRSERAATLPELRQAFGKDTLAADSIEGALQQARSHVGGDALILVTGSIYLVAEAYLVLANAQ